MKIILIVIVFISNLTYALPIKLGHKLKTQIKNEYIVVTTLEKLKHNIIKKLGKNIYLVNAKNKKALLSYDKFYPNFAYYGDYKESTPVTNDTHIAKQFHHIMIKTMQAWKKTQGNPEMIIAVTDNEFQVDHEDLKAGWWKNPHEIPDNNLDDDGNGYIDDIIGWDFIDGDNNVDSTTQPTHGTHVAGIIVATANNNKGVSGISPGVKVMPLRWFSSESPWTTAVIIESYRYAVDNGAKIISTSYGIDHLVADEAYLDTIKYIRDNNVLIFNSAGNDRVKNPARQSLEEVILVCSVKSKNASKADKKSGFSNYGTGIDICAPGDPIFSTVQRSMGPEGAYAEFEGTSMSTPAAAAVAALIWSAHPNFSDEEVRQRLYDSADEIDSKNFWYKGMLGSGRINAAAAVK